MAGVGGMEKGREGRGRGLHVRGLSQGLGPRTQTGQEGWGLRQSAAGPRASNACTTFNR